MNMFEQFGFTEMDGFAAATCVVAGVLGAAIDYVLKRDDLTNLPVIPPNPMPSRRYIALLIGRTFIGAAAGFIVWLVLVGSMVESKTAIAKLALLSIAAGFAAPTIGSEYQRKLVDFVVKSVKGK